MGYLTANIKAGTSKRSIIGGASKSIINVVNGLKSDQKTQIKTLIQKFRSKILMSVGLDSYVLIPKIIKNILNFKPDIIITQDRVAFPTIILSKIKKIPVINIVRAPSNFCPKYTDVTGYGTACSGIKNRKQCFTCINNWRSVRTLIGNKPKGWEYSIKASLLTVLYKIRYLVCLFNLYLMKKANINLVASTIMKTFFSYKVNLNKIKVINITPLSKHNYDTNGYLKRKRLMFIRTQIGRAHV